MKFETVLNAMTSAVIKAIKSSPPIYDRRIRQFLRFNDWLIDRNARMEGEISRLKAERDFWKAEAMQEDES